LYTSWCKTLYLLIVFRTRANQASITSGVSQSLL
jgi:hypothetical protein